MYEALFARSGLSLERLRSLIQVADAGGISRAVGDDPARQSLVSRQLKELEEFFEVELTRRDGKRLALTEKRVSVAWNDTNVLKAAKDLEKKAGVKIELHPCLRDRLKNRKVTWEANEVTLREALETLYVFPPPSVPARIDAMGSVRAARHAG